MNQPLVEGSPSFEISADDQSHGTNNTKKLKLPYTQQGDRTKLVLPEISLPSSGNYEFGIDVYRWGASNTQEGIRVYASTNGAIEGATELGFLYRIPGQTDGNIVTAEADDGWYTYFFPLPQDTRFIILRSENPGDHSVYLYLDNFVVKQRVFVTENQIVNSNPGTGQMTWEQFAQHVNSGHHFTNSTITLMEDITVGIHAMAGTEDDPFTGTFDGNGHSINADIQSNAIGAAPFRYIKDATIKNLKITGNVVSTEGYHAAGLVGFALSGTNTIENCGVLANVTITTYGGGIVGHAKSSTLNLTGCLYSGTITNTTATESNNAGVGGLVGWCDSGATLHLTNCIFNGYYTGAGSSVLFHPVACGAGNASNVGNRSTFTKVYYFTDQQGTDEGDVNIVTNSCKYAYTISGADGVSVALSGEATNYNVSEITDYANNNGLSYGDANSSLNIAGEGETVSLILSGAAGYEANQGTLTPNGATFTLLMAAGNTLISGVACPVPYNVAVTNITSSSAEVSWTGGSDSYALEYRVVRDGSYYDWHSTYNNAASPQTIHLQPETIYQVRVKGTCDGTDTDYSNIVEFTTTSCEVVVVTDSWSEGFEDGYLPPCWSNEGDYEWTVGSGDGGNTTDGSYYSPIGAHTGTYNAIITHHGEDYNSYVTKLITPVLDLTSLNHPMLTFWYINRVWSLEGSNDIDGFAVYYRTAEDAEWIQIASTAEKHETWTEASYLLPDPSANYQIAFEMTDHWGYGVGLDDVMIASSSSITKEIAGYGTSTNGGWYLIASPVRTVNVDDVTHLKDNSFDLYYFDQAGDNEGNEWINWKNNGQLNGFNTLEAGKGYLYANSGDVTLTFVGTPYSGNGQVTLNKTEGADWSGWNLVGNPFNQTAYLERAFYVINPEGRNEIILANRNSVEAMEGVFVIADEDGETMTFSTTAPQPEGGALNINAVSQGLRVDMARVNFGNNRTLPKFQINPRHTKVYIPQDGKDYAAVNAAETTGEMPLNFKAEKNGTYTLSFNTEAVSFSYLHLIDNKTGADVDLLALRQAQGLTTYTFEAKTNDYESRFKLVFNAMEEDGPSTGSGTFAFVSNGEIVITADTFDASLQVIDMTGRVIVSTDGACTVSTTGMVPGVYVLRLINGDEVKTQKIVIK